MSCPKACAGIRQPGGESNCQRIKVITLCLSWIPPALPRLQTNVTGAQRLSMREFECVHLRFSVSECAHMDACMYLPLSVRTCRCI